MKKMANPTPQGRGLLRIHHTQPSPRPHTQPSPMTSHPAKPETPPTPAVAALPNNTAPTPPTGASMTWAPGGSPAQRGSCPAPSAKGGGGVQRTTAQQVPDRSEGPRQGQDKGSGSGTWPPCPRGAVPRAHLQGGRPEPWAPVPQ